MKDRFPMASMALAMGLFSLGSVLPAAGQVQETASKKSKAGSQAGAVRAKSGPIRVNGVAAKVNGDVITLNELMIKVAPLQSVLMTRFPRRGPVYERQLSELRTEILDDLIDRTIIFTEFKDRVKAFPDREIEAEVTQIVKRNFDGDEELFRKYLKATNLTRSQFKEQQRKELLVKIVRSQQFGDVPPPKEEELRKEYKKWAVDNRERQKDVGTYKRIYLRKDLGDGSEAQLKLAEDISKKLAAGAKFEEMAMKYSNDAKAEDGGLWKEIPRTDLNREFGILLFETETNEVMGPLEDNFGYNLIQVTERKLGPPEKSYEEAKDLMRRIIDTEKKKANFEKWMKKMRSRAVIQKMIQ